MTGGDKNGPAWLETTKKVLTSKWIVVLLVLIPLLLSGFYRAYPVTLPATEDWAVDSIRAQYENQVTTQLREKYPTLAPQLLQERAREMWRQERIQNGPAIDQQAEILQQQYRERLQIELEKDDGTSYQQTYLLAIDPYYYLRRAENVVEDGDVCDEIIDGQCTDTYMRAPEGVTTKMDGHTVVESTMAKIFGWFGFAPMTAAFFLPLIFASLATIPAFFIARRRFGNVAGLVAGIVVALHTTFLSRTPAGFADTDVWNVFFPLFIIWFFILGFDAKDLKQRLIFMGLSGLTMGIYSVFWAGWYFTFFILFAVLVAAAIYHLTRQYLIKKKKRAKHEHAELLNVLYTLGIFLLLTGLTMSVVSTPEKFLDGFTSPFQQAQGLQDPVKENLWPNVLTTVAELNTAGIGSIINNIGGSFFFVLGVLGIFVHVLRREDMDERKWLAAGLSLAFFLFLLKSNPLGLEIGTFGRLFVFLVLAALPIAVSWKLNALNRWVLFAGIIGYYGMLSQSAAYSMPLNLLFVQIPSVITYLLVFSLPIVAMLVYNLLSKEDWDIHYTLFTVGWFIASIYATTQGVRFLFLLVPILALTVGFAAGWFVRAMGDIAKYEVKADALGGKALGFVIVLLVLFAPASAMPNMGERAHQVAMSEIPSMNDAWWNALKAVDADADPDAIITSWWDFGHWFKYVADRSVSFDGASQNDPKSHWVGSILQTDNQTEALGTLRMINCGANGAYELIREEMGNSHSAYYVVRDLIGISTEQAREVLESQGFSDSLVEEILAKTHCTPPDSYIVVSQDMVGKAGVWGHFGTWSFDRAFVVNVMDEPNAIELVSAQLGVDETRAGELITQARSQSSREALNTWVSGWPSFSGGVRNCQDEGNLTFCPLGIRLGQQQGVDVIANGFVLDNQNVSASYVQVVAQGQVVEQLTPSYLTVDGERFRFEDPEFNLGIRIEDGTILAADPLLLESRFTRWFHSEEPGPHLTKLTEERQLTGGKIIIYKADWDSYLAEVEG